MVNIPKILVFDIDEELISQVAIFLEEVCAIVFTSSDTTTVLERLGEIDPDLIIIGTEMPMINGDLPLTLVLKATNAPIMAIGHKEELVYMLELGADRFVSKPLSGALFIATVHSLLRQKWNSAYKGNNMSPC